MANNGNTSLRMGTFGKGELKAGYLLVCLRKAENIKGDDRMGIGRADPYAKLWLGSLSDFKHVQDVQQSKTLPKAGAHPVWEESFQFHIQYTGSQKNILCISFHNHHHLTPDHPLGDLIIDIPQVLARNPGEVGPYMWYTVYYKSKPRGRVELSLSFSTEAWPEGVPKLPKATEDPPNPVLVDSRPLVAVVTSRSSSGSRSNSSLHNVKLAIDGAGSILSTAGGAFGLYEALGVDTGASDDDDDKDDGDDDSS